MERAMRNQIDKENKLFDTENYNNFIKNKIIVRMKSCDLVAVWASAIYDVVTGDTVPNSSMEDKIDGDFIFSTRDIYHLEKYNATISDAYYEYLNEQGII